MPAARCERNPPRGEPGACYPRERMSSRVRSAAITALLIAAAAFFACFLDRVYPLRLWLFWYYAAIWGYTAVFAAACLAGGLRMLRLVLSEPPPAGERLTLGLALGVLLFFWGLFLGGLLGLYGLTFFFGWPLALLLWGGKCLLGELRRVRVLQRRVGVRLLWPSSFIEVLAAALLLVGIIAVYLNVITPENLGADAHGYHLPIAEQYVAAGRIFRFPEGWYLGAYPQLASILYAWAYMAPNSFALHTALAGHIELFLFLATLAAVATLVRRLVGRRVPWAGAAVFLFPGLLHYDSNLATGADHVLAFWAAPLGVALVRLGRRFSVREAVLAGALLGGAVLTKYQGSYFFVVSALAVLVMAVKARAVRPLLAWGIAGLLVTSAHWLKNSIFYGDPFYPLGHAWFPSRPFHEGAEQLFTRVYRIPWFTFEGTRLEKAQEALKAAFTFSFVPHNWATPYDPKIVFGSLFTLMLPVLPLLRPRRSLWMLVVGAHAAVVVWFLTSPQDRFLQALVPWFAACTAAMMLLAWRRGLAVRAGLVGLVGLQIVWGGDIYFYREHAMARENPLKLLVDRMSAGHEHQFAMRDRPMADLPELGDALPRDANVLLHGLNGKLGLNRRSVSDDAGWQGGIDYVSLETPDRAAALWREYGVTHVSWYASRAAMPVDELAREAVFARTVAEYVDPETARTESARTFNVLRSSPRNQEAAAAPTRVAWVGCMGDPPLAIYTPRELARRLPGLTLDEQRLRAAPLEALAGANAVIVRSGCEVAVRVLTVLGTEFRAAVPAADVTVWIREAK